MLHFFLAMNVPRRFSDKYKDTENVKASKKMFEYAGVKLTHFASDKKLTIDFNADTI